MSKINILDSSIFNLIAAGEVVERPVSVVKELIENSIDSGAKNITVEIKDGGTSFIQVTDDGCGIEEEDIKVAFLPHATSKIKNASDLDSIFTLGFRGEALASIASVAKVSIVSKTNNSELGTSLFVEGGKFGEVQKVGAKNGTIVTVRDLFFCVPARAKFLKKNKSEEQEITNIVIRAILAHPDISISYYCDGKKNLSALGSTSKEALFSVYGKEAVSETLEIFAEREGVSVSGFIGKPTFSKANRTYQTLIVNGRYVINVSVQTAVTNAYADFLMKRQYPFFVIYLTLPNDEVDVNVHPNKLDVRFLKPSLIYSVVFEAVSKALCNMDYIKEIDSETNTSFSFSNEIKNNSSKIDKAGVNLNPYSSNFSEMNDAEKDNLKEIVLDSILSNNECNKVNDNFGFGSKLLERINEKIRNNDKNAYEDENYKLEEETTDKKIIKNNEEKDIPYETIGSDDNLVLNIFNEKKENKTFVDGNFVKEKTKQSDFGNDFIKIIGKIFNTYIIIEWGDNVYLIDQHAAHERIKYEKLKEEYESDSLVIQPMLIPYVLSLNPEDNEIIQSNIEAIRSIGFDIEEFGERTYKISSVPSIVSDLDFNVFFNMFLSDKLQKNKVKTTDLIKDSLMQMACKSAVKGGDDLSKNEIEKLLIEMSEKNVVLFCPHGRPIVVRLSKTEIEKWFKRIV